jgi:hypothetical protein
MNEPATADEALVQSRMLLAKAIEIEDNQPRKLSLMDLLNVFRDFTEGQPVTNAVKTIANSVNHLENIARKLTKASNQATTCTNSILDQGTLCNCNPAATKTPRNWWRETRHCRSPLRLLGA